MYVTKCADELEEVVVVVEVVVVEVVALKVFQGVPKRPATFVLLA